VYELILTVTSVNHGAIRFYERLGFRKTGKTEPYPNDPAIFEYEMLLALGC
jgi:ribosomal protein S18 acetylase RimI-like enzyme